MKLRTRLNLVVTGLTVAVVVVLLASEFLTARTSVREEIEAANRAASQLLGRLAEVHADEGGPERLLQFLRELGRVHGNDIVLVSPAGEVLYKSPPPTHKAGRRAPTWFTSLVAAEPARHTFPVAGGGTLVVEAHASRAVLDVWDQLTQLLAVATALLLVANGLAFVLVRRSLAPFPVIADGLQRIQQGDLAFRLPRLPGSEAHAIGSAFNRMAAAIEQKVQAERKALAAETQLEERRELAQLVEQRVEEERRLIAHELHDEFSQSVTAIRSLALAITQGGRHDPATMEAARLIAEEAARLYDAMHGLIPRLVPLSLDTLGLAETLESLVRDWQRRTPSVELSLRQELLADPGPSVTLAIYRVVQEGLINALRHAQASRVEVSVRSDAYRMVVEVSDDGVGLPADWARPGHFGLRGLRERVVHLGGALTVGNRAPHGVCLAAEIPWTGER